MNQVLKTKEKRNTDATHSLVRMALFKFEFYVRNEGRDATSLQVELALSIAVKSCDDSLNGPSEPSNAINPQVFCAVSA